MTESRKKERETTKLKTESVWWIVVVAVDVKAYREK